uniref:Cyclin-like domain-containing protein n=1 Tax=Erythrolobus australicus TaxID=1077150 RepID=A0A7S1XJZ1_9RHOD
MGADGATRSSSCETMSPAERERPRSVTHSAVTLSPDERESSAACGGAEAEGQEEPASAVAAGVERERLIASIAAVLERAIASGVRGAQRAAMQQPSAVESLFSAVSKQAFSLEFYVRRLVTHLDTSRAAFPLALVYLRRLELADCSSRIVVSELNVHRLLITAVLVASKFLEDRPMAMEYVAKVGGVQTVAEMSRLEAAMLGLLEYCCYPSDSEMWCAEAALANACR